MKISIRNVLGKKLFIFIAGLSVVGCSSFADFKKLGMQLAPTQQVTKPAPVKPKPKKVKKMNHDCNYIVRDLSSSNANDVWCIPKGMQ